jgi:hypothetical protein
VEEIKHNRVKEIGASGEKSSIPRLVSTFVPLEKTSPKYHRGTDEVIVIALLRLVLKKNIQIALQLRLLLFCDYQVANVDKRIQQESRKPRAFRGPSPHVL